MVSKGYFSLCVLMAGLFMAAMAHADDPRAEHKPRLQGTNAPASQHGTHGKIFTLVNPVTNERATTSDPVAAAQYQSKGWILESSVRSVDDQPVYTKTFTLFNPVTMERATTSDPEAASQYQSKGWLLESTTRTTTNDVTYIKTFTFVNPVTSERATTSDPVAAAQYQSKGWILESTSRTAVKGEPGAAGYWLDTRFNVRHNEKCKSYKNTRKGRPCGPTDGTACVICGG